jgi:type IV pilus assembly protein PilV
MERVKEKGMSEHEALKKPMNKNGFTLLEFIMAMSILTVGILGIATMQINSIRGNNYAGRVSQSNTWASDKIEKLVSIAYDDFNHADLADTDGDGDAGLGHNTAGTADHQETQGDYTIFWNVSDNSLLDGTKTINVIVNWLDHGTPKSVTMGYIIPRMS